MYNIQDVDSDYSEAVTLEEVKAYMRIDADYSSEDFELQTFISAARERLEQYLNVGLANRDVKLEWNGNPLKLPLTPNGALVSIVDKDNVAVSTDEYTLSNGANKLIYINSLNTGGIEWFYSIDRSYAEPWSFTAADCESVYTAIYNTGYDSLPKGLKLALLAQVDFMYKNKGLPETKTIAPYAAMMAKGFSKNLVL